MYVVLNIALDLLADALKYLNSHSRDREETHIYKNIKQAITKLKQVRRTIENQAELIAHLKERLSGVMQENEKLRYTIKGEKDEV